MRQGIRSQRNTVDRHVIDAPKCGQYPIELFRVAESFPKLLAVGARHRDRAGAVRFQPGDGDARILLWRVASVVNALVGALLDWIVSNAPRTAGELLDIGERVGPFPDRSRHHDADT